MKIAEALINRADLQRRIAQIKSRLMASAKIQEGDNNNENPNELLMELKDAVAELTSLIEKINHTNAATLVDGESLTSVMAKKDGLTLELSILRDLLSTAREKINRYSNTEIRVLSTIDIQKLQKEVDKKSKELRELDCKLQEANWLNSLI